MSTMRSTIADQLVTFQKQLRDDIENAEILIRLDRPIE